MRYRMLKVGEIVKETDEYYSFHNVEPFEPKEDKFVPVKACTVGQALLDCNVGYYRRPLTIASQEKVQE